MTSGQIPVPHHPVKYSTARQMPPLVNHHRHGCAVVLAIVQQNPQRRSLGLVHVRPASVDTG